MEKKRIYNSNFRKDLKKKISTLNNKQDYLYIYKIISKELDSKFSINKNGVYFNINLLSDDCINDLSCFILEKINSENVNETSKIKYETYYKDQSEELDLSYGNKFSNQEKSILKKLYHK
jgi:hypothetical protein